MAGPWEKYGQQGASTPAASGPWSKYNRADQGATPAANPPQMDAYQQSAQERLAKDEAAGLYGGKDDYSGKFAEGAGLGWYDELQAGARAGLGTLLHPGSSMPFSERYKHEKAYEEAKRQHRTERTGAAGTAAEIAGGIVPGLVAAGSGATLMRAGQGLIPSIAAGAGEGAAYGAISGAGSNDKDRIGGAIGGGLTGGVLGGAAPVIVGGVKTAAAPIVSNIHARINPKGYAENQLAKTLERSGRSAADVTQSIADANAAGQSNYVLADALGESGQKQLGGLMKSPGAMKQEAADYLLARNRGMGRQVGGFVDDAFNTHGNTAQDYIELMENARSKAGDVRYDAARASAGPVDLNRTLSTLEDIRDPAGVLSSPTAGQTVAPGGVERAAQLIGREGAGPTGAADFNVMLDTKRQIGDIANEATRAGRGYEASQVGRVQRELDSALQQASPGYRRANDTFSRMSRPMEGVEAGQRAVGRGRAADNINNFNRMERPEQQGFRVGYADKLNEGLGGPSAGGKINEMLHGDVADEIGAFASPGRADMLNEQLQRSADMIRTGNIANGGSPTAELLGQQADIGIDPIAAAGQLMGGNIGGAIKSVLGGLSNGMNGNTEAVRNQLIPMLLSGKIGNGQGANLGNLLQSLQDQAAGRQAAGINIRRGISSSILPTILQNSNAPSSVNVTPESQEAFINRTRLYGGR